MSAANLEELDVDEDEASVLESTVIDALDGLDSENSSSLHIEDGKVVCDKDELAENIMLMCALTAHRVANK